MFQSLDELTFEQAKQHLYAEVISDEEAAAFSTDTVYRMLAGCVRIAFIVDIPYLNGPRYNWPITARELSRWQISIDTLVDVVGREGSVIRVNQWDRVKRFGKVYQTPDFDRDWTPNLLRAGAFDALDLRGPPLVMIADAECAFVTGLKDWWGVRCMLRTCLQMSRKPLTRRPLLWENGEWVRLEDRRNPARLAFRWRLGAE